MSRFTKLLNTKISEDQNFSIKISAASDLLAAFMRELLIEECLKEVEEHRICKRTLAELISFLEALKGAELNKINKEQTPTLRKTGKRNG